MIDTTDIDFQSSCESINTMLKQALLPELTYHELRSWGVQGGEGIEELKDIVDRYINSLDATKENL